MDITLAKKIGRRQTLKAIIAGLIIAYAIMAWFEIHFGLKHALLWFKEIEYKTNLLLGVIAVLIIGWFLGQQAGLDILIKNKNKSWTGIKFGLLTVWASTFIASLFGLFQDLANRQGKSLNDNPFFDYLFKPFFWVTFFGFIPIIILGIWLGYSIGQKNNLN